MTTPNWVTQYVAVCVEAFGLAGWRIQVQMLAYVGDGIVAASQIDGRSLDAILKLRNDIQPDDNGYQSITHELDHIRTIALEMAKDRIVELLPPELREHAAEVFKDADEPTTERLAKSLTPVLRKMLKVEK